MRSSDTAVSKCFCNYLMISSCYEDETDKLISVFSASPTVHVFAKRSIKDKSKLKLTCMATGFYPRDVTLGIRKSHTSLPEDETESTGIRPNHDGSYQMRTSVETQEDEKADYDCFVSHRALKETIIVTWGN